MYSVPANTTIYNVDDIVRSWNPVFNMPIIGDIVTGTIVFFNLFRSLIWGFPDMLEQIGVDPNLTWGLRVLLSTVLAITFIQLISGRHVED